MTAGKFAHSVTFIFEEDAAIRTKCETPEATRGTDPDGPSRRGPGKLEGNDSGWHLGDGHQDFSIDNFDGVTCDAKPWRGERAPGGDVILPTMSAAGNDLALEFGSS